LRRCGGKDVGGVWGRAPEGPAVGPTEDLGKSPAKQNGLVSTNLNPGHGHDGARGSEQLCRGAGEPQALLDRLAPHIDGGVREALTGPVFIRGT